MHSVCSRSGTAPVDLLLWEAVLIKGLDLKFSHTLQHFWGGHTSYRLSFCQDAQRWQGVKSSLSLRKVGFNWLLTLAFRCPYSLTFFSLTCTADQYTLTTFRSLMHTDHTHINIRELPQFFLTLSLLLLAHLIKYPSESIYYSVYFFDGSIFSITHSCSGSVNSHKEEYTFGKFQTSEESLLSCSLIVCQPGKSQWP